MYRKLILVNLQIALLVIVILELRVVMIQM